MRWLAGLALFLLGGCVVFPETTARDARIIAIGDSIVAWNRPQGASIADVVEKELGVSVLDASVPGARMRQAGFRGTLGFSIPDQYRDGMWDAVILNGGGNDLFNDCGCNRCDAVLNRLTQQDYPALLDRIGDRPVFILGYYGRAGDRRGNFDRCEDDLIILERRLVRLAASRSNVTVVQFRREITGQPEFYDDDRIHPSPSGSRVIGEAVARALVANASLAR